MPILIVLLALLTPPQARWDTPTSATIQWTQTARACLWAGTTFVGCYDGAGERKISLGKVGPTDGRVRPGASTVYKLVVDGVVWDVPLRSVVHFPVFRS
jgi:hypothetical protein